MCQVSGFSHFIFSIPFIGNSVVVRFLLLQHLRSGLTLLFDLNISELKITTDFLHSGSGSLGSESSDGMKMWSDYFCKMAMLHIITRLDYEIYIGIICWFNLRSIRVRNQCQIISHFNITCLHPNKILRACVGVRQKKILRLGVIETN